MRKIVHVNVFSGLAGAQRVSLDILSNIGSEFDRTIIFGGEPNSNTKRICQDLGIKVVFIPSLRREIGLHDFRAFFRLYRIFRNEEFDIVHTNSTKPGIIARIAARLAGIPIIVHTIHGIAFHRYVRLPKRAVFYLLELFSVCFGNFNISVNNYYLRYYPTFLGYKRCIYNGVNFGNLVRTERSYRKDVYRVGFFARFDEQKDPFTFIKVAEYIINNGSGHLDIKFVMAGDGPLLSDVKAYVNDQGIEEYFEFHGWVDNKSEYLSTIDVLLQPSLWEAFGLNIVEAAYLGVPSIASDVEGVPEVIIDGHTGYLSSPGDVKGFSECLLELLSDPDVLESTSKSAMRHVESNFSLDSMVKSYLKIYTE